MKMPIYEMLKAYPSSNPLPFHMPGHLLGRGLSEELKIAGCLDITEIPGSDCLHHPQGVIREAQELVAHLFGAGYSLFLVNGSTSGIHTMVQAVVKPGGKLIIGRDCHRSVLSALALINAEPIYVLPERDDENQIPLGITELALRKALSAHPDAQGILLTRPNYYGVAQPLEGISELARQYRIPLFVDEAHGAHFRFHKAFPDTALELGADLCVQSLHKTLPALTQTALLHGNEKSLIARGVVEKVASMVQTTSPSYLFMASIDTARQMMEDKGEILYEDLWQHITKFNEKLEQLPSIKRVACCYDGYATDFSRIVLSFKNTQLSGFKAEELLRVRYGVFAEMADLEHVVLIATPFHSSEDFNRLFGALKALSEEFKEETSAERKRVSWPNVLPERILTLREALFHNGRELPIKEALGAISAVSVIPYPPGIPLLNPGERISSEFLGIIEALMEENCPVHGISQDKIQVI